MLSYQKGPNYNLFSGRQTLDTVHPSQVTWFRDFSACEPLLLVFRIGKRPLWVDSEGLVDSEHAETIEMGIGELSRCGKSVREFHGLYHDQMLDSPQ